ncbi:4-carboxy-4-hydroxy-2-oxoadipate aldolase/oxaloacetate decarboxylase [Erwinia sp. S43]|uniref:4-carboxy-4-hydroxy-2-oxoadipate aldolase/oxaloacetate decarboxylase n=1 Tax=unclassified Erwinia TaxID=2622719 RepID=UPI001909C6D5|nr:MULTISPECIES: 4-carboxy-4-hydroxy-2-oxoadipate aldolase/oxaloacetate decarboxylase [unclassified Erwinia]MBK0034487.1 4-carboxy-4-hydroxy-2-oxoadipate aldolase/oxaloacetate decarboxylase [Erwinia sp. S43]MCW1877376.1 4-carboxy-4-hydroxy-2-oxoadipate aldolase/oxaloacetate decarboxylase [Erwinia sp. INIA01]
MLNIIHTRPVVAQDVLAKFKDEDVATIHEALGRRGAMNGKIRPLKEGMKFYGRALTVKSHPADNLMLIKAINMASENDVIVLDMGDLVHSGPFGEVLAVECAVKKIAGLVFSCTVRDSAAIKKLNLPVFSSGVCVEGTAKATLGYINQPVTVGGVIVHPGDIIIGDDDGVVCVPFSEAEAVLSASVERREKESVIMQRLRNGESLFDIYHYQQTLDLLQCREESVTTIDKS